jgi:uncharacterized protein YkwD
VTETGILQGHQKTEIRIFGSGNPEPENQQEPRNSASLDNDNHIFNAALRQKGLMMRTKGLFFTAVVLMATVFTAYGGLTEQEQKCFDAVNQMRTEVGLAPFEFCPELTEASRSWSARLRSERRLYHGASYENCARGNTCGVATFRQWYNSPGHRALLLNRSVAKAGVGQSENYWTFRVKVRERATVETKETLTARPAYTQKRKTLLQRILH